MFRQILARSLKDHGPAARQQTPLDKGLVLPPKSAVTKDVPSDGNCLFHAFGVEATQWFSDRGLPSPARPQGQPWRDFLLSSIRASPDSPLDGSTVRNWLASSDHPDLEAYLRLMSDPDLPRGAWGGFLEISFMCHFSHRDLACYVLEHCPQAADNETFTAVAVVGKRPGQADRFICIAWLGNHWVRARAHPHGARALKQWSMAS